VLFHFGAVLHADITMPAVHAKAARRVSVDAGINEAASGAWRGARGEEGARITVIENRGGREDKREEAPRVRRGMVRAVLSPAVWFASILMFAPASKQAEAGDPLTRKRGPVFSVSAAPRLGIMLAGGADVISRVGFGAGLDFRVHALHLAFVRFGALVHVGHTQYLRREAFAVDGQSARLFAKLWHSDFGAGPSLQLLFGPVFCEVGVIVGAGISMFSRPLGPSTTQVEQYDDVSVMLRGAFDLGIPIRRGHGVVVGAGIHRYFSDVQVPAEPPLVPYGGEPDTNPFDLMLEFHVGYHFMF